MEVMDASLVAAARGEARVDQLADILVPGLFVLTGVACPAEAKMLALQSLRPKECMSEAGHGGASDRAEGASWYHNDLSQTTGHGCRGMWCVYVCRAPCDVATHAYVPTSRKQTSFRDAKLRTPVKSNCLLFFVRVGKMSIFKAGPLCQCPLSRRANCISLGWIVLRFAWAAQSELSSKIPVK